MSSLKVISNVSLSNIVFPVFKFRKYTSVKNDDGIVYVDTYYKTYIVDNTNLEGETLGERRLRVKTKEFPLYPFKVFYRTPRDLILKSKTGDTYIDAKGRIFKYKKTARVSVKYYEIKSVIKYRNKTIVHFKDFPLPVVLSSSKFEHVFKFGGFFKFSDYYMFYSFEEKPIDTFKIRI